MGNADKEADLKPTRSLYDSDRSSSLHQGLTSDAHAGTHLSFTYKLFVHVIHDMNWLELFKA